MLISSKVTSLNKKVNASPNHCVVLTSNITLGGKNIAHIPVNELAQYENKAIELHVAIWGMSKGKLPLHSVNPQRSLTFSDFMTYYYGLVAA